MIRVGDKLKKLLITLLIFSLIFITGCNDVSKANVDGIFQNILYLDNNLTNTNMDGFSFYLPHGVKIVDKNDFNVIMENNGNTYYLYIDVVAYHYKTNSSFKIDNSHYVSQKIMYNGKEGYIDIVENDNKYYVLLEYNYAKVESIIKKEDLTDSLIMICSVLSSVKYNDVVIDNYIGEAGSNFQEEKFNIFKSQSSNDNFLKYEKEFGTYKDEIVITNNDDVIDIDEVIE